MPASSPPPRNISASSESARIRYLDGDGRVFLNRNKQPYDLILLDAFHGGYIPFHLLTKEFFRLVKKHLTPNGAVAINVHDGTKLFVSTIVTHAGGIREPAPLSDRRRRSDRSRHDAAARRQGRAVETSGRDAGEIQIPLSAAAS